MSKQDHIVKEQIIELHVADEQLGIDLQNRVADILQEIVYPQLEQIFDELSSSDEVIEIDELTIDLGFIQQDKFETMLPEVLVEEVRQELSEQIHKARVRQSYGTTYGEYNQPGEGEAFVSFNKKGIADSQHLIHFLRTGNVQWQYQKEDGWSAKDTLDQLLQEDPARLLNLLLQALSDQAALKRFIYQFDDERLLAVVTHLNAEISSFFKELYQTLTGLNVKFRFLDLSAQAFRFELWSAFLTQLVERAQKVNEDSYSFSETEKLDWLSGIFQHLANRAMQGKTALERLRVLTLCIFEALTRSGASAPLRSLLKTLLTHSNWLPTPIKKIVDQESVYANVIQNTKPFIDFETLPAANILDKKTSDQLQDWVKASKNQQKTTAESDQPAKNTTQPYQAKIVDQLSTQIDQLKFYLTTSAGQKAKADGLLAQKEIDELLRLYNALEEAIRKGKASSQKSNQYLLDRTAMKSLTSAFQALVKYMQEQYPMLAPEQQELIPVAEVENLHDTIQHIERSNQPLKMEFQQGEEAIIGKPELEELFINNAGLVLFWGYLNPIFKHLGLVDNREFVSEEAKHRAVHLLQYMGFENSHTEEHELALNKLLCGIPVEEPLIDGIELTDEEKQEIDNMLGAVIRNWEALKNTSLNGFRKTFIPREGHLTRNENDWNLVIERVGFDVMLDTLPWTISMIKMPWTDYFIYVQW